MSSENEKLRNIYNIVKELTWEKDENKICKYQ